jgi:hypothetical protein
VTLEIQVYVIELYYNISNCYIIYSQLHLNRRKPGIPAVGQAVEFLRIEKGRLGSNRSQMTDFVSLSLDFGLELSKRGLEIML